MGAPLPASLAPVEPRGHECGRRAPRASSWNSRTRQYLVVFLFGDEGPPDLSAVRVSEQGLPVGEPIPLPVLDPVWAVSAAARPVDGSYLITWTEEQSPYDRRLFGQLLDSSGRRIGTSRF